LYSLAIGPNHVPFPYHPSCTICQGLSLSDLTPLSCSQENAKAEKCYPVVPKDASYHPTGILTERTKLNAPFASHEQLYISCFIGKYCPNALTVGTDTDFQN